MTNKPSRTLGMMYVIYFLMLQGIYLFGIAPLFSYQGLVDEFNLLKFFAAFSVVIVISLFVKDGARPSDVFLNVAVTLVIVPSLVIFAGADLPGRFILITILAISLMALSAKAIKMPRIMAPAISTDLMLYALIAISGLTVVAIIALGGLRYLNFNFAEVYNVRREASDNLPGLFGYLTSVVTKVIIPFGMVLALVTRRWVFTAILAGLSVFLFALTANKSPLIYPLFVLFFYFVAGSPHVARYLLVATCFVIVVGAVDLWYLESYQEGLYGWFASLLIRRLLLVPSLLNWEYIEYFSGVEKYYWANSKFSFGLVDSPHLLGQANLISLEYSGDEEGSANTGWIGSGYANAGIVGVVLYSIVIGALLAFLDRYAKKLGPRITIAAFILPVATAISSADLSSIFLNHGLIVAIILLVFVSGKCAENGGHIGDRLE